MLILQMPSSILTPPQSLSSAKTLSNVSFSVSLTTKLSHLTLSSIPFKTTPIRMGGGPRTFPGGVSKWQWKRMQAKKAKQLLKARLARERQIYEMRKRAELKAAVSELERPWETVEKPPNLFSVSADEHLKVLADRFQKPGGLDLWSERDGPELFRPDNGLPSSRFFPKGVVHSVKPYGAIDKLSSGSGKFGSSDKEEDFGPVPNGIGGGKMGRYDVKSRSSDNSSLAIVEGRNARNFKSRSSSREVKEVESGIKGSRKKYPNDSGEINTGGSRFHSRNEGRSSTRGDTAGEFRRRRDYEKGENINSKVFDMRRQNDGSFKLEN